MRKAGSLDSNLVLDRCEQCRGFWFDGGEVRQFLNSPSFKERFLSKPAPPAALGDPAGRSCPKCDKSLNHLEIAGVEVDVCVSCMGVWLDDGELDHLVEAGKSDQLGERESLLSHEIREGLRGQDVPSDLASHLVRAVRDLFSGAAR